MTDPADDPDDSDATTSGPMGGLPDSAGPSAEDSSVFGQVVGRAVQFNYLQEWVGQVLGQRFVVKEFVKSGGQGGVFRGAEPGMFDRVVAIKIVPLAPDTQRGQALIQEAKMLAKLDSDDVVRVLAVGGNERGVWMVMDWLDGIDLAERLNQSHPLTWQEAFRIAIHVLGVLEKIHPKEAHFDIKPSNIFITAEGRYKVLDLGLAKLCDRVFGRPDLCVGLGTPRYASPEQLLERSADYRSDLYSVGATLFHMLTGTRPFEQAKAIDGLRDAHRNSRLPSPRSLRGALPRACDTIVAKATQRQAGSRYESAAEFRKALEKELRKPRRPWSLLSRMGVAAAVAMCAVAAIHTWWPRHALSGPENVGAMVRPQLKRLTFYVGPDFQLRRTDPQHQVPPICFDLLGSGAPVDVPVRAGRDDMRLEAEFDRPVKWHLLWQDPTGQWFHLSSSDGAQSVAAWPAPVRPGEEPQTPTISSKDPEGLHVLFLVFGDLSGERIDQLLQKPPVTEGPPLTLVNRAGSEHMGPETIRGAVPIPTGQEYLARIKAWLPQSVTVRYVPIIGKKD